jgi:membrane protease YdiL (CAAX protease family)
MSANWVSKAGVRLRGPGKKVDWRYIVGLPIWVAMSFIAANFIIVIGLALAQAARIYIPDLEDPVFNTVFAALIYVLTLALTLGGPWLLRRRLTSKTDLGLSREPSWMDILLAPAGAVLYLFLSGLLVTLFSIGFPQIDLQQAQDVGFKNLSGNSQYLLAFITLVVVAPLAEEVLFRGYLYGKLRKHGPIWLSALITSVLFGLAHGQWNVAIDTFALSLILCSLREVTGSIWAGTLLHMMKNGLAFYLLFINPSLLDTLVG